MNRLFLISLFSLNLSCPLLGMDGAAGGYARLEENLAYVAYYFDIPKEHAHYYAKIYDVRHELCLVPERYDVCWHKLIARYQRLDPHYRRIALETAQALLRDGDWELAWPAAHITVIDQSLLCPSGPFSAQIFAPYLVREVIDHNVHYDWQKLALATRDVQEEFRRITLPWFEEKIALLRGDAVPLAAAPAAAPAAAAAAALPRITLQNIGKESVTVRRVLFTGGPTDGRLTQEAGVTPLVLTREQRQVLIMGAAGCVVGIEQQPDGTLAIKVCLEQKSS